MFDDRLKNLRIEKGLNMKETAKKLGLAYTTYVGYEKNEREPNSEILLLLSNFFECSIDYLVGRSCKKHKKYKNTNEIQLIENYRNLNIQGQTKLLEYSEDLVNSGNYKISIQKE